MTTTERYPVGLTAAELQQRAWVEGDLRTVALLELRPAAEKVDDRDQVTRVLCENGQLPLEKS